MKTLKNQIEKRTGRFSIMLMLWTSVFFLMFTACQKEESISPANQSGIQDNTARFNPSISVTYTMITVRHLAGDQRVPEYTVSIQSDGWVTFNGIKNTVVKGARKFQLPGETVVNLQNMFLGTRFIEIPDDLYYIPGRAMNATAFASNKFYVPVVKFDNGINYPREIIDIRTKVEDILVIHRFVYGTEVPGPELMNGNTKND